MKTFENKTVVITGGTSGIGKATALAFSQEGANVVVSGRRISEGENVVREITSAGGNALFVRTDVSREEDTIALIEKTVRPSAACMLRSTTPAESQSERSQPSRRSSSIGNFATSILLASCSR